MNSTAILQWRYRIDIQLQPGCVSIFHTCTAHVPATCSHCTRLLICSRTPYFVTRLLSLRAAVLHPHHKHLSSNYCGRVHGMDCIHCSAHFVPLSVRHNVCVCVLPDINQSGLTRPRLDMCVFDPWLHNIIGRCMVPVSLRLNRVLPSQSADRHYHNPSLPAPSACLSISVLHLCLCVLRIDFSHIRQTTHTTRTT